MTSYTYDALGNLITVLQPGVPRIDYVIDAQNRRVGRKVNGVFTRAWLYQNQLNPVAELDGAGNIVSRFVYGTRANVPDYMIRAGVTYRMISDNLGSVRLVVDTSTGVVVQRMDYDEWGNVTQNTNPGFQPFGFASGLYDEQTGLVRFGSRDYDPTVGRWTLKDPLLFGGGDIGLYTYSGGDPVNHSDPTGLLFGGLINAGECAGESAARHWAEAAINEKRFFPRLFDNAMGLFASLWTRETSDYTFATLLAGWGLSEGALRVESGNWKNGSGQWQFGNGPPAEGWHFHWGEGAGLQGHHLPYEFGDWLANLQSLTGRGLALKDLINLGAIGGAGLTALLHKLGLVQIDCGCEP
jgi:RHS repeat-associated protein